MSTQVTLDDGFKTSRVIHVSHYIPSICRRDSANGWSFTNRRGHSAMNVAIRSLSPDCQNFHLGYVGRCLDENDATLCHNDLSDEDKSTLSTRLQGEHKYIPVFSEEEAAAHYEGYCKTVWVHDYHLMLVPEMVRKLVPEARIGFFLHAPFPSSENLSARKEILNGVLASNLIGLQVTLTPTHAIFSSTCTRVLGLESAPEGIDYFGNIIAVEVFPIGIDVAVCEAHRESDAVLAKIKSLKEIYPGKKIIFGRDKIDQATGLLQKFKTFELFLQRYPEWQGKVVLVQVSSSPQSLPALEKKIAEVFVPVHHFQHLIAREEYYGLLSIADVALITSVRDGMNTTSHEFVICQRDNFSPLILSEFTGTAGSLKEAMLVNPFDYSGVAETIHRALSLSYDAKAEMHSQLYKRVTTQDAKHWARSFISSLDRCCNSLDFSNPTPALDYDALRSSYKAAKKRLLLFDYDGTLTEIRSVPSAAVPSDRMLEGLRMLTRDERNVVWIISGRDQKALQEWMGDVSRLGLSAEHGCFMKEPHAGSADWVNLAEEIDLSWKDDVLEIFTYYTERTQGSFIEHKRASLAWHYRIADPEFGSFQAKECQNLLENTVACKLPVDILIGKKNIEVRPIAINKGEIVKRLLTLHPDVDFVFCAGDDKTDEDMFRALKSTSIQDPAVFSCSIGSQTKKTLAKWRLDSPREMIKAVRFMGSV
ncbi:hypothetical protein L0F63_001464 [Massospora cicadina]|nr:hypothetical protein L0F63_001464 [Massospora cicadina]